MIKKSTKKDAGEQMITVPAIGRKKFTVMVVGDTPLICHAWSKKAIQMMLDKQMKKAKTGKEAKNPESDFQESLYHLPDGKFGFKCSAFKQAAVAACRFIDGVAMTEARGAFYVLGDFTEILGGKPVMREDMVRLNGKVSDIRYRGEFKNWKCKLTIEYNASVISPEQIINLLNNAGFGVGVGEWRPDRNGTFGMFHVETK